MTNSPSNDDANCDALVERARTDREAFGALFDRYFPVIWRYCRRRNLDANSADDVAGEVFLQVARAMRGFPGSTELDFRRWIYRIATNAIHAHHRQSARRGRLQQQVVEKARRDVDACTKVSADGEGANEELLQAFERLSTREQTVLTLRYMEELSYDEVAATVGLRPATLRVVVSRALARLRELMSFEPGDKHSEKSGR